MNIFTENPDFYPTPREVIEKMLMNENIVGKTVLEPSAGKGDICEVLREYGASNIIVCENYPHNKKLLAGKYDEFLADDFLSVKSEQVSHVDYIVMNPPFSRGVEHIIHAFEIAPDGCTIIALCNNNVLGHSYGIYTKKLNELIEDYGNKEYLGSCFSSAERQTDVKVSLIHLYKEKSGKDEFNGYIFEQYNSDALNNNQSEGLVSYNIVRDLVNRYTTAVKLFDETMEAAKRINEVAQYSEPEIRDEDGNVKEREYKPFLPVVFQAVRPNTSFSENITHNMYKKELRKYYWNIIFRKLNVERYSTRELREQMNRFIEKQVTVPFTMRNIYNVINIIVQTNGQRMQRALVDVFDKVCSLSAQNNTAGEKWKTNANYMLNKKFIIDYVGDYNPWNNDFVQINYGSSNVEIVDDMYKALCWLTGKEMTNKEHLCQFVYNKIIRYGEWFEWGFFRVKVFKKRTAHFVFLDENLWALFNQEVAKVKGWNLGSKANKKK